MELQTGIPTSNVGSNRDAREVACPDEELPLMGTRALCVNCTINNDHCVKGAKGAEGRIEKQLYKVAISSIKLGVVRDFTEGRIAGVSIPSCGTIP